MKKLLAIISAIIILNNLLRLPIEAGVRFVSEDPNLFSNCPEYPAVLGFNEFVDTTELEISIEEDGARVSGNMTFIWDVEPNDLIELKSALFKYERNNWIPTPFYNIVPNLCTALFQPDHYTYNCWGQYIQEQGVCPYKGVIYHLKPLLANFVYNGPVKFTGTYKSQVILNAYNELHKSKATICIETVGIAEVF